MGKSAALLLPPPRRIENKFLRKFFFFYPRGKQPLPYKHLSFKMPARRKFKRRSRRPRRRRSQNKRQKINTVTIRGPLAIADRYRCVMQATQT